MGQWDDSCGRCGNSRLWWRSRMGYLVCMVCSKDPLAALEVLARRAGSDAVQQVQRWQVTTALVSTVLGKTRIVD